MRKVKIKKIKRIQKKGRTFSQKQINQWLKNDQLTANEQKKIDELINRLP